MNDNTDRGDDLHDGIDRRGFLKCMAWAGTGALCSIYGGVLRSAAFGQVGEGRHAMYGAAELTFAQISDSHIGFSKEANPDVIGTFRQAVARIQALPTPPSFLLHTGDISHLSKPEEFDTVQQILKEAGIDRVHYVPGEHDVLGDNGGRYLERFGGGSRGGGWTSFDEKGVHFIGLVNVLNLKAGGLGALGAEQLEWLAKDLSGRSSSTPVVLFAHIPLWTVYPEWGWGTDDSAQALELLKRFGSVTVLNGHIHQTMQKVEGNVAFHTAMSTAFPQPAPGSAPSPGPMKVDPGKLRSVLGVTSVHYVPGARPLAIIDSPLESATAFAPGAVAIDNFQFAPATLSVSAGTKVTWTNHDDIPHVIAETNKQFVSPALDTDERFAFTFQQAGVYDYYCTLHPRMTGKVVVR